MAQANNPWDLIQFALPLLSVKELQQLKDQLVPEEKNKEPKHCCASGHKFKNMGKKKGWFGVEYTYIYCERCGFSTWR